MTKIVIGVSGGLHSGKTTFTECLRNAFLTRGKYLATIPFAAPLKELCRREFGWDGEKDERGRRLLQVVGTDAGRAYNPRIWVDKWVRSALAQMGFDVVVADDCRFDNEAEAIHQMGGVTVRLLREGYEAPADQHTNHESERGISSPDYEFTFRSGDTDGMQATAQALADALLARAHREERHEPAAAGAA